MLKDLFKADNSFVGPILRLTLVIMMLPMGYLKIIDFSNMLEILKSSYNLPALIAFLVIVIEFFVPLLLLVGLGSRIGGLLLAILMLGALTYHIPYGYHMNWYNLQEGEGFQFHLLAIGTSLALFASGGGRWSIDKVLVRAIEK